MRFGRAFYLFVILICVVEMVRLWNVSPEQMAAHFDIQGNPDRFVPRLEFFGFQVQTLLIVLAVSILPQVLFLVLPVELINMPNRDYWFAPDRRTATLDRLSSFGAALFGCILLVIQVGFELAVYANLQTPIHFNAQTMVAVMAAGFVLIGLTLVQLVVSFRTPASGAE
jgi:uncharacterized membrane protein